MKFETKFKETEIGEIPEGWDIQEVKDLGKVITGKTPPTKEGKYFGKDYPFIKIPDMGMCVRIENSETMLSHEGAQYMCSLKLPSDSVMVSCLATIGKVGITAKESFTNQQINSVIPNINKVIPEWIYYYFKNNTEYLESLGGGGSVYTNISKSRFESAKIILPRLTEQRAIAKILSDLDANIELNVEMNKTLEAIGQALFKHWFVDFDFSNEKGEPYKSSGGEMVDSELGEIPKSWSVKKLGNYVDVVKGCSYRSADLQESDKALVTLKSIERGGGFKVDGLKQYIGKYRDEQIISPGEIVVSHTDITQKAEVLGKSAIVRKVPKFSTLIASLDLCIVRPVINILNRPFVYFLLKTENFQNHAFGYANGTTVLHLNKKAILEYVFGLPSMDLIHKFGVIVNNIMEKIQKNEFNSETLTSMRDSLLPRLMSGKIRVSQTNNDF